MARTKRSEEERREKKHSQNRSEKRKHGDSKEKTNVKQLKLVKPGNGSSLLARAKAKALSKTNVVKTTLKSPSSMKSPMKSPMKSSLKMSATTAKPMLKLVGTRQPIPLVAKRHQAALKKKEPRDRISWAVISKTARKSGIKRLYKFQSVIRDDWFNRAQRLVQDSLIYCDYMRKKTLNEKHLLEAAQRQGERFYCESGF